MAYSQVTEDNPDGEYYRLKREMESYKFLIITSILISTIVVMAISYAILLPTSVCAQNSTNHGKCALGVLIISIALFLLLCPVMLFSLEKTINWCSHNCIEDDNVDKETDIEIQQMNQH